MGDERDRTDRWDVARWFVLACVCATGCSLGLSGPDPKRPRNVAPQCDTSKGIVAIDTIAGLGLGITAAAMAGSSSNSSAAIVPALLAATYLGAALHGSNVVDDCRKAMTEYAAVAPAPEPPSEGEGPPIPRLARARIAPVPVAVMPSPSPSPSPSPAPAPSSAPAPAPAQQQPPPPADVDPWADFWKEVR